jgi:hypothetical protein
VCRTVPDSSLARLPRNSDSFLFSRMLDVTCRQAYLYGHDAQKQRLTKPLADVRPRAAHMGS